MHEGRLPAGRRHACVNVKAQETALDPYVNRKGSGYGWKLIYTAHGEGDQAFVLEFGEIPTMR